MKTTEIIGLMSGTSMDALDIAHVRFKLNENSHQFECLNAASLVLPHELKKMLQGASEMSVPQFLLLDKELGVFFADSVEQFIQRRGIDRRKIDAIASHGQTIFHQPEAGFTCQIGCGSTMAHRLRIPVINDFRTRDVVAGGQGAPLADTFVNIGGFVNLSTKMDGQIVAFDVCPGNLPMNKLAAHVGLDYDKDGQLASSGEINFFLLDLLNSDQFYNLTGPKSLGTEWLEENFYPLIKFDREIENNLRTLVEHCAIQLGNQLSKLRGSKVLLTGGGAKNSFLVDRIRHYFGGEIILPDEELIEFKEAIVFAYLGVLYMNRQHNCLASVTGAEENVMGGVYHAVISDTN
jgi:anhydro-N-acetylmuramic acid kinase